MMRTESEQSIGKKGRSVLKSRFIKFSVAILPAFFLLNLAGYVLAEGVVGELGKKIKLAKKLLGIPGKT